MKNIIIIFALFAAFVQNVKAQFVPDFEFYLYLTDAVGNRDSVLVGYANNTNISFSDYGTEYTGIPFKDTLELRFTGWDNPSRSWKKGYDYWDCAPDQQTFGMGITFSCMYPPVELSWDASLFQDNCRDNSVITTNNMQLVHPHFDDALHITMSSQGFMSLFLDTSDLYRYPATIYPNQTMQSGATDTLFFVFMTFANDSLTINVDKTQDAGVKIYPTLAQSFVNVSIDAPESPEVLIYNLNGQLLQRKENDWQQLDISHLAAGVYVVEVRNGKSKYREKIIKL